jgi:ribosomal protein S18 acetylase RimI-like enzyme
MRVGIRRARVEDALSIAWIHAESFRVSYASILPDRYLASLGGRSLGARWHDRLLGATHAGEDVWVVDVDDAVVGFSQAGPCRTAEPGFAEVSMLYLHPRATGHGLGGRLFRRAVDDLGTRGFRWLSVWVLADNRPARRFYARMGLREDGGTRWDRFGATPVRVVRYSAPLAPVVDFDELRSGRAHPSGVSSK